MITRHYKRIVKDILQRGGANYDAYQITAADGAKYYTAQEAPYIPDDQTAVSMSTDDPGVIIGSGSAAASETNSWLASQITSGFSAHVTPTHSLDSNNNHVLDFIVSVTNESQSSIIVSEIGYALITPVMNRPREKGWVGAPYRLERNVLIDRTVLQTPVTIAAGSTETLKYSLVTKDDVFAGGGAVTIEALTATTNGTYTAPSGKAYSPVTVNVANSYSAGDEGKVVSNGALVAQTARSSQITENGTYDTTNNNSVTVNVSGGSLLVEEWDFTQSQTGIQKSIDAMFNRINRDTNGATSTNAKGYIGISPVSKGMSFEFDITTLGNASTKRLFGLSVGDSNGLYFNGTEWTFVTANGTEQTGITDADYFNGSTVKVSIDTDGKWKVYKNNILVYSFTNAFTSSSYLIVLGTTTTGGMLGFVVTAARIYNG